MQSVAQLPDFENNWRCVITITFGWQWCQVRASIFWRGVNCYPVTVGLNVTFVTRLLRRRRGSLRRSELGENYCSRQQLALGSGMARVLKWPIRTGNWRRLPLQAACSEMNVYRLLIVWVLTMNFVDRPCLNTNNNKLVFYTWKLHFTQRIYFNLYRILSSCCELVTRS